MRRWIAAAALAGAALMLTTGCSTLPEGVDGNLTNNWADFSEPTGWTPESGKCQGSAFSETLYLSAYTPVSCNASHATETIAVGQFDATVAHIPSRGGADYLKAYNDCDAKATEFLGGHWQDGKVWLGVSLPSSAAWGGGARWYRCEVVQLDDSYLDNGQEVSRSSSLKDALKSDAAVQLNCLNYNSKTGDSTAVACTTKHNTEFVGTYFGVTSYSALKNHNSMAALCYKVIAKYAGIGGTGDMKYRVGVIWDFPSQDGWDQGDHGLRCWAWFGSETKTKSIKGAGSKGLPIHYA